MIILRESFESRSNAHSKDTTTDKSKLVPDGISVIDLAKRQLEAHGLKTNAPSMPAKLRQVASRGLQRIHRSTKRLFAISDGAEELTQLKKLWGLRSDIDENNSTTKPPKPFESLEQ